VEEGEQVMDAKVRDVMTPGPIGVDYYQSIADAARTMRDWGIGAVLVVHDQALRGLVTDRDLVIRALADAKSPDEPVGPLSSGDLIGVDADADVSLAARLMRENAVRRLPVLEDGQVAGVVSLGDLGQRLSLPRRCHQPSRQRSQVHRATRLRVAGALPSALGLGVLGIRGLRSRRDSAVRRDGRVAVRGHAPAAADVLAALDHAAHRLLAAPFLPGVVRGVPHHDQPEHQRHHDDGAHDSQHGC
jgi:CBS domain-containing protein